MTRRLYIAAKAPIPGYSKSRLGQSIGDELAIQLYRAMLRDLAAEFEGASFPVTWFVTPTGAWDEMRTQIGWRSLETDVLNQPEIDFTERQRWLFQYAHQAGIEQVIMVTSDCPEMSVSIVERAFAMLNMCDVVIGPARDGGYNLLGMRGYCDILAHVKMSTSTVTEDILENIRQGRWSYALMDPTLDVDTVDCLPDIRTFLARTNRQSHLRTWLEDFSRSQSS